MTAPDADPSIGQQTPPSCFRHPDRETWVSCVRCGRHACPDCLREAAVGQQCVECVRSGNSGVRRPRTFLNGRVSSAAAVTWTILGLNVLLYLVELAYSGLAQDWWMIGYASPTGAPPYQGVAAGQWYRLLTSAFLPGTGTLGLMDIAFNMWVLFAVGPALEQMLGHVRFLGVYLLSALGGSVLFYYLAPQNVPALGASGAIFGLFGAWFVVSKRLRLDSRGIMMLIAINLAFSFMFRGTIAWQDHVGGLIVGALITVAYAYAPRKNRLLIQISATAATVILLAVAVALRTSQLTALLPSG